MIDNKSKNYHMTTSIFMLLQMGSIAHKSSMFILRVLGSLSPLGKGHVDTCMFPSHLMDRAL